MQAFETYQVLASRAGLGRLRNSLKPPNYRKEQPIRSSNFRFLSFRQKNTYHCISLTNYDIKLLLSYWQLCAFKNLLIYYLILTMAKYCILQQNYLVKNYLKGLMDSLKRRYSNYVDLLQFTVKYCW